MNSTGYRSDKLNTNRSYRDVWEFAFVRLAGMRQLHAGCRLSSINCATVLPVDYSDYQCQNTFLWICGIKPERLHHLSSVAGQQDRKKNYDLQLDLKLKKIMLVFIVLSYSCTMEALISIQVSFNFIFHTEYDNIWFWLRPVAPTLLQ